MHGIPSSTIGSQQAMFERVVSDEMAPASATFIQDTRIPVIIEPFRLHEFLEIAQGIIVVFPKHVFDCTGSLMFGSCAGRIRGRHKNRTPGGSCVSWPKSPRVNRLCQPRGRLELSTRNLYRFSRSEASVSWHSKASNRRSETID